MNIAHVVRYYPKEPYTNGLEVATVQLHESFIELGYKSKIIAIDDPHLFKTLKNFDKIIIHFRRSSALKVVSWCNSNNKKNYLICHNGIGNVYARSPNLFNKVCSLFCESHYLYRKVSGIIVFNFKDYCGINTWFPNLKKAQAFWGVDQKRFKLTDPSLFYKKLNLNEKALLIICPGRIHPGKNLILPLKIWDEIAILYPQAHLVFIGHTGKKDSKYYKYLKSKINTITHKNRIHWINDITYNDEMLIHAYSAASVMIFPSLKESFGLVVLETCAIGKPIIASPVGVVPSLIKNGINGFICDPQDDQSWKKNLLQVLKNKELRKKIGGAAKKEVKEKYTLKESALKILEFIRDDKPIF